jgi:hypothetical protein
MRRVLALLACVAVVAGCGGDDEATEARFDEEGAPFAFDYPPAFEKVFTPQRQIEGSKPTYEVLHGTDEANWVLAATYDTGAPVDLADPEDQRTVDRVAQHLATATGWKAGARQEGKLGPLPAFSYPIENIEAGLEGRLVYAFNGPTEYFMRCEWDTDGADVIPGGCDQVQESFEPLGGAVRTTSQPASSDG